MSTHWVDTGDVLGDGGASKASVTLSSVTARGGGCSGKCGGAKKREKLDREQKQVAHLSHASCCW